MREIIRKTWVRAEGILVVFALLILAIGTARAEGPLHIRIAWTTVPGQLTPVLFGPFAQKHLLRYYGKAYVVTHYHFAGAGPMGTALASGRVNIASLSPSALGFLIENAHVNDIKIITDDFQDGVDHHFSIPFFVRRDSRIKSITDLKGKVVAVNAFGGAIDAAVRAMLLKHHLVANKNYTIIEQRFPDLGAMLEQRKVDLVGLPLPFSEVLERRGNVRPLFRMKDVFGQTQMLFNVARASFLKAHKAALRDFFVDYLRALHWLLNPSHRHAAVELVARFTKRPASIFSPYLFTSKDVYRNYNARPNIAALQRNMDQLQSLGILKKHIKVVRYTDLSFIEDAAKQLEGEKPRG